MKKRNLLSTLRYKFDNLMSKGTLAMISLLGITSLLIVIVAAAVISLLAIKPEGEEELNFIEGAWLSLMRTLDPGTMGGDSGWTFRIIAFLVTIGGIFIISTLIGVLNNGIEAKLDQLRQGRSFVIEKNHTLILGWSTKIFTIISELSIANENKKKPRIVILAEKDKVEMEDEIKEAFPKLGKLKIVCRNGSPNNLQDIEIVNPQDSKSIIILSDDFNKSDAQIIKTILAITKSPNRRIDPYHITTELNNERNIEICNLIGGEELEIILSDEIIAKIIIQTSRQSGLSIVYQELMDFDGAEIYFAALDTMIAKTYSEVIFEFNDSAVIGINNKVNSIILINPPMDYVLMPGDEVIAITEDDDSLIPSTTKDFLINEAAIQHSNNSESSPEKILMLGWNTRGGLLLRELNDYVAKNSIVDIISSFPIDESIISNYKNDFKNLIINFTHKDTTDNSVIKDLNIVDYNSIQVLCYREEMETQEADASTMITLLHLRHISETMNKEIKIVSEMLDIKNRDLANVTKADDFIVSDKLISLMMSQVSENKQLMRVFEDLMRSEGSEIYLKPINDYIKTEESVNFYTLMESAKRRGDTAIGYRINSLIHNQDAAYGVVINPKKDDYIQFTDLDKIIVLSEEG
jgi:ion channel POLLUX/CASTOR